MSLSGNADVANYSHLKQLVNQLKQEHQEALDNKRTVIKADSYALAEQKHHYEAIVEDLNKKLDESLQQNKRNVERFGKVRQSLEREKQKLHIQLEVLTKTNEELEAKHRSQLSQTVEEHQKNIKDVLESNATSLQEKEEQMSRLSQQQASQMCDLEQWCQGEIDAVRHTLEDHVQKLKQQANEWQARFEEERRLREEAEAKLRDVEHVHGKFVEDAAVKEGALEDELGTRRQQMVTAEEAHVAAVKSLEVAAAAAEQRRLDELAAQRQRHSSQLELIDERLQRALAAKDGTIGKLRTELEVVTAKLRQFETILED